MNYEQFSKLAASEKAILCTIEAVQEAKIFTLYSGSVYYRDVDHVVVSVKDGSTALTKTTSTSLSAGQWYFDETLKRLYVRTSDSANPKTKQVSITFKLFFSDIPVNLPWDLDSGYHVPWDSRLESLGSIGQKLDEENTGIVLESTSSINLINTDRYFDEIFDTLIWENQRVDIYSWSPSIDLSEKKRLFRGFVTEKTYDDSGVSFKVRDIISKLQDAIPLETFQLDDGEISDSVLYTPKRRIFGRMKQLRTVPIDLNLVGYPLTGTISGTIEGTTLTGVGTLFRTELSPGDELIIQLADEEIKLTVDSIGGQTTLEISNELDVSLVNVTAIVNPKIPWANKNRRWHVAGHKLRAPSAEIIAINDVNKFQVDTTVDLFSGDVVTINGVSTKIRRISGDVIVLNQAVPTPSIGDLIQKSPIYNVFFGSKELFIDRDFTLTNTTTDAILEIDDLAEFNITNPRSIGVDLDWTNNSRFVTTSETVDLRTILKPHDWIRKNSLTDSTYYSVLQVKENEISLRIPFTGTTETITGLMKNVEYINDDSVITTNCLGMEHDGEWVKTAADAVKHILQNDAAITELDTDTFDKANAQCDYVLSMVIPESIGSDSPKARDVITKINESVFGSVYLNLDYEVSYSILNSTKPDTLVSLKDDDILDFSTSTNNNIVNSVVVNYRPFTDIFNDEDTFEVFTHDNDFVNRLIGIKNQKILTAYLYDDAKATIIGQRYAFFNSLSNSSVKIKTKLQLVTNTVNDKVFLDLDRLYKRYGGGDRRKIGMITSISKNGRDTDVEIIDLGNLFNRVPSIAPSDSDVYAIASEEEIIKWGYVLDNFTLTPDESSEAEFGNNLIG